LSRDPENLASLHSIALLVSLIEHLWKHSVLAIQHRCAHQTFPFRAQSSSNWDFDLWLWWIFCYFTLFCLTISIWCSVIVPVILLVLIFFPWDSSTEMVLTPAKVFAVHKCKYIWCEMYLYMVTRIRSSLTIYPVYRLIAMGKYILCIYDAFVQEPVNI